MLYLYNNFIKVDYMKYTRSGSGYDPETLAITHILNITHNRLINSGFNGYLQKIFMKKIPKIVKISS